MTDTLKKSKLGTSQASTDPSFLPRSEFWHAPITSHSFALVSFNGNEILRLANCPENVVQAVRRALPQDDIRHFKEDTKLVVCEFLLAGKPFAGRSVRQEQLLLNLFSAILSQHYTLVTSIDYGRIYLDKLTLAFQRPLAPSHDGIGPPLSHRAGRVETFGLSFVSTTALRVVSPPLSHTPAILQVVRSAWPLGVVNEKRESDGSYMFKLKGYSFFKQSTFETDSLAHILALLKSMDAHGFSLITSISLAKRSRVQDFWIFGVPAPPLPPSTLASKDSIRRGGTLAPNGAAPSPVQSHSMLGLSNTEPSVSDGVPGSKALPLPSVGPGVAVAAAANIPSHMRSASVNPNPHRPFDADSNRASSHIRQSSLPGALHVLRKTPPVGKPGTPTPARGGGGQQQDGALALGLERDSDFTPRPSPREGARALQPSPSRRDPTGNNHYQQQQQYPSNNNANGRYPLQSTGSTQLLYTAAPPPGPEPVYNTVPSGAFLLSPPQAQGPRTEPGRAGQEDLSPPYTGTDDTETSALLGSSVFRSTIRDTVRSDSLLSEEEDEESDDEDGRPRRRGPTYLGNYQLSSPGLAGQAQSEVGDGNWNENDARRFEEHFVDAQGHSPRVVHPSAPDSDPSRRVSDQPLVGFVHPPTKAQMQAQKGIRPGLGGEAESYMTRDTAYETAPGTPRDELSADDDEGVDVHHASVPILRERLRRKADYEYEDDDDEPGLSAAADHMRATTKAAAAEMVSYSNSAAKHPPHPPPAPSQLPQHTHKDPYETIGEGEALTVRVNDEHSKTSPWVLVREPPPSPADVSESPSPPDPSLPHPSAPTPPAAAVATEASPRPAAVPVPIPTATNGENAAFVKHSRKGSFPWSKSRREQKEKEKEKEKEKDKNKLHTNIVSNTGATSVDKPLPKPKASPNPLTKQLEPERQTQTPAVETETGGAESSDSSRSSSSTTSSSSALPTPTIPPDHTHPPAHNSPQPQHPTETKKGLFGRRKAPIAEVGVADRRLTID